MQSSWSLIFNVLLLSTVVVTLLRRLRHRRKMTPSTEISHEHRQPSVGIRDECDDIIAVRKIERVDSILNATQDSELDLLGHAADERDAFFNGTPKEHVSLPHTHEPASLVIFLCAKNNRQFFGYELLQTLLASGLRFGEGGLFHRHQHENGQGTVLCSLATATSTGVFDLENIGAFSVHGLCLFMHVSGNVTIDEERFTIMLETAKQLTEDLDALLLDDERRPWSGKAQSRYVRLLQQG